jgi:hypothetical protein
MDSSSLTSRSWQPIENAPKDGEDILVWGPSLGRLVVSWDEECASSQGGDFPWMTLDGPSYFKDAFTHWMPLPEPPK